MKTYLGLLLLLVAACSYPARDKAAVLAQALPQGDCPHELGFVNSEKTWTDPAPAGSLIEVNYRFNTQTTPSSNPFIYLGKAADRVGGGDIALVPSGLLDATFQVTISGGYNIIAIELRRVDNQGVWNTIPNDSEWILGAARTLTDPLLNSADGSVNLNVSNGQTLYLFAEDPTGNFFADGTAVQVSISKSDGTISVLNLTTGGTAPIVIDPSWQLAGYVPSDISCMSHAATPELKCFRVRLVDANKNPLSSWSIEQCEQKQPAGVIVK